MKISSFLTTVTNAWTLFNDLTSSIDHDIIGNTPEDIKLSDIVRNLCQNPQVREQSKKAVNGEQED